jgi:hypothetical protein
VITLAAIMRPRVYIASFFADKDRVRERSKELIDAGMQVTARWYDEKADKNSTLRDFSHEYFRETGVFDVEDVIDANVLILTVPTPEQCMKLTVEQLSRGGRHFESGLQYGLMMSEWLEHSEIRSSRRRLILLGPRENVFHFLDGIGIAKKFPKIEQYDTWEEVVKVLKGE